MMPRIASPAALLSIFAIGCSVSANPAGGDEQDDLAVVEGAASTDPTAAEQGFVTPSLELEVPPTPGRNPTMDDVIVKKGFDGRTPEEAVELVKARLTNPLDRSNVRVVETTAKDTHKRFTIVVNNAFVPRNPTSVYIASRLAQRSRVTVVGVMSALHPVYLRVDRPGAAPQYLERQGISYTPAAMPYKIVMEAEVKLTPSLVKVTYPSWSMATLAGPTSTVEEL